ILDGGTHTTHVPRDRRRLLPLAPADRAASAGAVSTPGHAITDLPAGVAPASGPRVLRRRLTTSPWAPLKLASGCDRRCSFCAIPAFRGSYLSRPPKEVLLVSENSSSYGKDLGDLRLLEKLLPELAAVDGLERIRVTYMQPAEMR